MRRSRQHSHHDERAANGRDGPSPDDYQRHTLLRLQRAIGNRGVQRMHAPARVVQRQPDTSDIGPIGDPMEFIEAQLARTFVDPHDPRLAVRVRRLQEAVARLPTREAKDVLGRLRDRKPSDALSQNFQRLATPSRQTLLRGLRNRLPSDIEGKRLGTLTTGAGPTAISTPLVAAVEIVPSTEEPGSFAGFADADAARQAAVRRPTISAIVTDKRLGLHRVFETGVPTVRPAGSVSVTVNEAGVDYELEEWVNVEGPALADPADRAARIQNAKELRDAFFKTYQHRMGGDDTTRDAALKKVEDAFMALVEEAVPFASGQVRASMELDFRDRLGKLRRLTTAVPSMINIDITGMYRGGFQAALDPVSEIAELPGAHERATIQDLFTVRPPMNYEPYLALTPSSITDDPLETRMALLHEEAHLAHDRRTIELYDLWNASMSGLTFEAWVKRERDARRVSAIDAALAIEAAAPRTHGFLPHTELLAEVEGFMAGYHAALPSNRDRFLDRLSWMGHRWSFCDPEVQAFAMRKFRYYYDRTLRGPGRQAFDEYVLNALMNGDPNHRAPAEFYVELVKFAEAP